jgi:hypothetical protein
MKSAANLLRSAETSSIVMERRSLQSRHQMVRMPEANIASTSFGLAASAVLKLSLSGSPDTCAYVVCHMHHNKYLCRV